MKLLKFYLILSLAFCCSLQAKVSLKFAPLDVAELVSSELLENSKKILYFSALRKINQNVFAEQQKLVKAEYILSELWSLDAGHDFAEVQRTMRQQLPANTKLLFSCAGRDCGRNNHWANNVFGENKLLGIDDSQFYWIMNFQYEGDEYYVLAYAVSKITRKRFYYRILLKELNN